MTSERILDVRKVTPAKNGRGANYYTLVLPQKWVKDEQLDKGGRLLIKQDDHRIILEKLV